VGDPGTGVSASALRRVLRRTLREARLRLRTPTRGLCTIRLPHDPPPYPSSASRRPKGGQVGGRRSPNAGAASRRAGRAGEHCDGEARKFATRSGARREGAPCPHRRAVWGWHTWWGDRGDCPATRGGGDLRSPGPCDWAASRGPVSLARCDRHRLRPGLRGRLARRPVRGTVPVLAAYPGSSRGPEEARGYTRTPTLWRRRCLYAPVSLALLLRRCVGLVPLGAMQRAGQGSPAARSTPQGVDGWPGPCGFATCFDPSCRRSG